MPPPRGLVQWLDQGLHRSGLLARGGRFIVAVSGGADSVALLRLLVDINQSRYWGWKLVVGHVDHGMRGAASAADARFVRALARRLRLPCRVRRLRLKPSASEDAAREGRLRILKEMTQRTGARCAGVIMAHHADDQAETVLMRLMRGCGLEGLSGIADRSAVHGLTVFRPLLGVRRATLRIYLGDIGQDWREDATNAHGDYLRNRLRADVLPRMEALWPRATEAIGRAARLAGEAQELMERLAGAAGRAALVEVTRRRIVFQRQVLRAAPALICGQVLRTAAAVVGRGAEAADFERIRAAVRIVVGHAGGKQVEMGQGVVVRVERTHVTVEREKQ